MIAVLALAWTAALVIFGGVDLTLFGRRVRTHEPLRPLAVATIALILFVPLYGAGRAYAWWRSVTHRLKDTPLAAGLSIFVFIVGMAYGSTAAGGSDSYGYVSAASLWLKGDLHVAQPWTSQVPWPDKVWTFTPLGYQPIDWTRDASDLRPTVSRAAALMAGAMYWADMVRILDRAASGAVLVFAFLIGRRLGSARTGRSPPRSATSPVVLFMLDTPMTDAPAAAAWAVAIYGALGGSIGSALVGLGDGLAILIRRICSRWPVSSRCGWS
jgi:hypothetical protein